MNIYLLSEIYSINAWIFSRKFLRWRFIAKTMSNFSNLTSFHTFSIQLTRLLISIYLSKCILLTRTGFLRIVVFYLQEESSFNILYVFLERIRLAYALVAAGQLFFVSSLADCLRRERPREIIESRPSSYDMWIVGGTLVVIIENRYQLVSIL